MPSSPIVGFLGNSDGMVDPALDFRCSLEAVGENTGNLMFQHACWNLIDNPKVQFRLGIDLDLDEFRDKIDVLFIPAANQLNPDWDLESWASLIEYIDKPVIIAGLGAQAKIGEVSSIDLQPGTRRFVDVVANRAPWIGVRGEDTARLLSRLGVKNAVVTGCPSNFINDKVTGRSIARRLAKLARVGIFRANYVFGTMEDFARKPEADLFRLWRDRPGHLVYQTGAALRYLGSGALDEDTAGELDWQNRCLQTGFTGDEYLDCIRERGIYFDAASKWMAFSSQADLTFGMRIHGAVAAIQGGSVGVCVVFDSRTLELVETMAYPHLMAEAVSELSSLEDLVNRVEFSAERFDQKRWELGHNLRTTIEHHGVTSAKLNRMLSTSMPAMVA